MADQKAQPYTFDLGHLLCNDTNPVPAFGGAKETVLSSTARDCAQALINQLLTACPISRSGDDGALQITLPTPATQLPREKPVPKEKEKTSWEKFADKKGIKSKKKDGKLFYDEAKGVWVPKYGFKGKKGDGAQDDWLVEIDDEAKQINGDGEDGKPVKKRTKKTR